MPARRPLEVLMLYMHLTALPMRPTMASHLRFLEQGGEPHRVAYLNLAGRCPPWIRAQRWDLVVLHYSLLAARWTPRFARVRSSLDWLRDSGAAVVAMPQDEYDDAHVLDDWLQEVDADVVYSIFGGAERDALYPRTRHTARFEQCFTGYVDPSDAERTRGRAAIPHARRPLDVAYRAGQLPFRLGRRGQIKHRLAEALEPAAARTGLRADVSTAEGKLLFGDDWFNLLASSRVVAGCESGASAMDPRGEVRALETSVRAADPQLTFEQFAERMPAGWDGHAFGSVSPRHFEAALVGSCQLLVQGEYAGVLEPDVHYVPVRPDLTDIDAACERLGDAELVQRLAERAYQDLVASGEHTYAAFARRFEDAVADSVPAHPGRVRGRAGLRAASVVQDQAIRARPRLYYWSYIQVSRRAPRLLALAARARSAWLRSSPS
jgi:glycosyl transferase family 1